MSSRSKEIPGLDSQRSSHCPVVREGPALGCNFCWNTRRILRRKTKYHCPECQTNLCIAPCFQEYHERQSAENPAPTSNDIGSGCVYGVGGLYAKVDLRFVENLYFCGIVSFSLLFLMGFEVSEDRRLTVPLGFFYSGNPIGTVQVKSRRAITLSSCYYIGSELRIYDDSLSLI
ncbi:uncharacterized protein LOC134207676 [Armigeres subalbatus]|uniref:uncharacterized protein LOC134207676 n=1 Tax=Armigeres subalbatus TaxID=124917 RepID=UPI002ECFDC4E